MSTFPKLRRDGNRAHVTAPVTRVHTVPGGSPILDTSLSFPVPQSLGVPRNRLLSRSLAPKAGHEYTCGSPGSVPAGHGVVKTDTWIDPDPWETGTRTCGSGFDGYFRGSYLRVPVRIASIH